jgi:hypothetical protein
MNPYETLSEAIRDLNRRGYTNDFNLHTNLLECARLNLLLQPEDFMVDEVHRLDGTEDPGGEVILLAIRARNGIKGILLDGYGTYSDALTPEMAQKLQGRPLPKNLSG